jgi:hypothetical protein
MKKSNAVFLLLLIVGLIYFFHCNFRLSPIEHSKDDTQNWTIDEKILYRPQDLVAVTAYFEGEKVSKLVLVDFYNIKNYKIISDTTMFPRLPRFSRDKRKILFCDYRHHVYDYGTGLTLYDIVNETFQILYDQSGESVVCYEIPPVWNYDDSGFFTSSYMGSIKYYRIEDQYISLISRGFPIGLKGQDILIAFASSEVEPIKPPGYWLLDSEGNFISKIENTYLKVTKENLNWNDKLGFFIYAEYYSTTRGYKISVTDLYGNYYKSYTSGCYNDKYPVWGPEGKYILFDRMNPPTPREQFPHKIMIINLETGKVRDFLKPGDIPGTISIRYPDF